MTIRKEIDEGSMLPAWYGVAWRRYDCHRAVCYPIPLNLLLAVVRHLWVWMRHGGRIVPLDSRDAYAQGYRDGQRKAPMEQQ